MSYGTPPPQPPRFPHARAAIIRYEQPTVSSPDMRILLTVDKCRKDRIHKHAVLCRVTVLPLIVDGMPVHWWDRTGYGPTIELTEPTT